MSGKFFPEVARTAVAIRDLRIQGAINVTKRSLSAMRLFVLRETPSPEELRRHANLLLAQRPTEPALKNTLERALSSPDPAGECARILAELSSDSAKMTKAGISLIPDGGTVMTHCHASSVTAILKSARAGGKRFSVLHTETRPMFQGHRTAQELLAARIHPTMFVDSAINFFMPEADLAMVGADALVSGGFINKIGTSLLALSAREHRKPLYVVCGLVKYSRDRVQVERRPVSELGFSAPGLHLENPAFDFTPARFVKGIVCEAGVVPFRKAVALARKKNP
jgi:ribose 1,5-bisphosphate isomerase